MELDPNVLDQIEAEYDEWFDTLYNPSKNEHLLYFDMHGDYADQNIVEYTKLYHSNYNTYNFF